MTSAERFLHRGHGRKDRWPTGALAAVAVGALLAVAPSVAMGQADEEYLPPPNNPGNNGGPSGNPGGTPSSGDVGTGSPGGGGSGNGGTGGGSGDIAQPAVPSEDPSAAPTGPAEVGSGSDNRKRSQGARDRDPAEKLPNLPPLSESVKPTVAFGATTAAANSSDVSTIAILAGIMLAVTLAAVLLRRRLSGSRSP